MRFQLGWMAFLQQKACCVIILDLCLYSPSHIWQKLSEEDGDYQWIRADLQP